MKKRKTITVRWTQARAIADTERQLKRVEKQLSSSAEAIGYIWGDVDQYMVNLADQIRDGLGDVIKETREALAFIGEHEAGK
jgi:hypothetical protein